MFFGLLELKYNETLFILGHHCDRPCDEGTYGEGCKEKCNCLNSGACNPQTGQCTCSAGWQGDRCEKKCDFGVFGFNCSQKCECNFNNSIACDAVDGHCLCKDPWTGKNIFQFYV